MDIERAYKIHEIIENIKEQNREIDTLYRAVANVEYFTRGELTFIGGKSNGDEIMWRSSIGKENVKLFLELLLDSMTDKKKEFLKQIDEI